MSVRKLVIPAKAGTAGLIDARWQTNLQRSRIKSGTTEGSVA